MSFTCERIQTNYTGPVNRSVRSRTWSVGRSRTNNHMAQRVPVFSGPGFTGFLGHYFYTSSSSSHHTRLAQTLHTYIPYTNGGWWTGFTFWRLWLLKGFYSLPVLYSTAGWKEGFDNDFCLPTRSTLTHQHGTNVDKHNAQWLPQSRA